MDVNGDPTTVTTTTKGKPRKRVSEACAFCRRRKIRCNSDRPSCSNCKTYGHECVYLSPGHNTRRNHLQPAQSKQPEKLNDAATSSSEKHRFPSAGDGDVESSPDRITSSITAAHPNTSQTASNPTVSRIIISDSGTSSYHGRTSALFEENVHDRRKARADAVPTEWVEKGLVAEASLQRQMEVINFRDGKLDLDGVEPELGMHLLNLHWNRQHHSFLITYRPAFMRDMACNGRYFSKILLNAIYYGSSKFTTRLEVRKDPNDVRTAGWSFRQRVRELLGNALDGSEITTIQALLVMANSLFALGDERSAAWLYSGLAFRMIIDLGMHAEAAALSSTRNLSHEDLEIRRRVFWGAFVVDKIMSLYQGRPASLQEADTSVPLSFLDKFEENENWTPFAYSAESRNDYIDGPAYSVSTFTALCGLSVIMNKILNNIYAERIFDRSPNDLSQKLDDLHSKMESWNQSLATHLQFDPSRRSSLTPPPHVLSLGAMYHVLLILLHRPFVADGHLHNTARSITVNSLLTCATAATQIVRLLRVYDKAFSVRRAPYLISYATYVSATIHVRIAAKRSSSSEAHKSLNTCLAVLRLNQETNWAARRAKNIVEGLMTRLKVELPDSAADPQAEISGAEPNFQPSRSEALSIADTSIFEQLQPDGFSPGLDIDAVIQSFAPPLDNGGNGLTIANGSQHPVGTDDQKHHMDFADQNPIEFGNAMFLDSQPPQPNDGWYGQFGPQTFPFNDLLFGFDGSIVDNCSMSNYPQ